MMDGNEPVKYIEKIVLEIVDRPRFWFHQWRVRRIKKFNIAKFNAREAAYAFLKQYDGEHFVKAQKIAVWYNAQELHLRVRDLIYGTIDKNSKRISNSMVEFIYRKVLFSEIKWPPITANRTNRVRWANDNNEITTLNTSVNLPDSHIDETANVNTRVVPCMLCNNLDNDQSLLVNSTSENLCQDCRVRRSMSDLQKLITGDDGSLSLGHNTDDEDHFRSSIHIHVNQIQN